MIIPVSVDVKFRETEPHVRAVAERVVPVLSHFLEPRGYAFVHRVKQVSSVAEKLEGGRYRRWSDLDDLFACAIVIPTLAEEEEVLTFLRAEFQEVDLKLRGSTLKDPLTFRFDATRFIGTLKTPTSGDLERGMATLKFEVQIRTAFEHAWTVTTHKLAYKGEHVEWRRLRLIAQLKAAVEQIDNLIRGFDNVAGIISEENWPEVNLKKQIEQQFRSWVDLGAIPTEATPDSWVRFTNNVYDLLRGFQKGKRYVDDKLVNDFLQAIGSELQAEGGFPRSVSLLQFGLGVASKAGLATGSLGRYCPVVTPSLRSLFPSVDSLTTTFDFEMTGT